MRPHRRAIAQAQLGEVIKYYDRLAEQLGQTAVRKVPGSSGGGMEFL